MEIRFRPAGPGDAPELKRLNNAFNGPGEKTAGEMAADLAALGCERVFAAERGEKLVGFCCCQIKRSFCYGTVTVEIAEMYVEPAFRGRGVGKGLLDCAMGSFRDENVERFEILTGDDNLSARGFYEHAGFSLSGEVHYESHVEAE